MCHRALLRHHRCYGECTGAKGQLGTRQHSLEEREALVIGVPSPSMKASLSAAMWNPPNEFTAVTLGNGGTA